MSTGTSRAYREALGDLVVGRSVKQKGLIVTRLRRAAFATVLGLALAAGSIPVTAVAAPTEAVTVSSAAAVVSPASAPAELTEFGFCESSSFEDIFDSITGSASPGGAAALSLLRASNPILSPGWITFPPQIAMPYSTARSPPLRVASSYQLMPSRSPIPVGALSARTRHDGCQLLLLAA